MARTPVDETAKKKPASKTTAKKATVKKTAAKKATVKKTASVKAPAKKATTKKAPAKKATAKKATAKKTTSQTEQKPKTEQKAHNTQNQTHTPDAATEALREGFDNLINAGRAVVDRLPSFLKQAEKRVSKVLDSASKNYEELEKNTKSFEGKFVKSFKDLLKNRRGPGSGGGKGPQP